MSFNVRYDNPEDGENAWKYRKSMVVSLIEFHHIDIAGIQEVLNNQMKYLVSNLHEYGIIGVGREDGKTLGEFAPIVYLKERFNLKNQGVFWLSKTPLIPNSIGWDAVCTRITTWAEFFDKQSKKSFFFFNTHFDHIGLIAMRESSYLLKDKVEKIAGDTPVIVTGDFNSTESSEVYEILTGETSNGPVDRNSLKDSHYISVKTHHGPNFTFHDFKASKYLFEQSKNSVDEIEKYNATKMDTIDYIFIKNNVKVLHHGILSDSWDGKFPSDHMPVVADLRL